MFQETADFNHNVFVNDAEADKTLLVRFYNQSVQHKSASIEQGRPIYREKEYIEIKFAGNRADSVIRPATQADIQRFPLHYDAFKRRKEMPLDGTPLKEWPRVSRSQVEELAYFNIKTVEQLASVKDSEGSKFMGFHALKESAKTFLKVAESGVKTVELQKELAKRDDEITEMKAQIAKLTTGQYTTPVTLDVSPEIETSTEIETPKSKGAPKSSRRKRT